MPRADSVALSQLNRRRWSKIAVSMGPSCRCPGEKPPERSWSCETLFLRGGGSPSSWYRSRSRWSSRLSKAKAAPRIKRESSEVRGLKIWRPVPAQPQQRRRPRLRASCPRPTQRPDPASPRSSLPKSSKRWSRRRSPTNQLPIKPVRPPPPRTESARHGAPKTSLLQSPPVRHYPGSPSGPRTFRRASAQPRPMRRSPRRSVKPSERPRLK